MMLLVVLLSQIAILLAQNAQVSFLETAISVGEFDDSSFTLRVQKTGRSDTSISILIDIISPTEGIANDFRVPYNQFIEFSAGDAVETQETTWYILNDDIPEDDEVFTFELSVLSGAGQVTVSQGISRVTIEANDDAYGIIGFSSVGPLVISEDPFEETIVNVTCSRERGAFSSVSATFEIMGIELTDGSGPDDILPSSGSVVFKNNQSESILSLRIIPDQIPENEETFEIRLLEATDGAKLDGSLSKLTLKILKNDSPLQFAQAFYLYEEDAGAALITVNRGLAEDGVTQLGPDDETVTVGYFMGSSSGTLGLDAVASNGTLTFLPREYTKTITITILSDNIPEIGEDFEIILANSSSNAVIAEPSVAVLTILGNDDQNGVLFLKDSSLYVTTGEDTGLNTNFIVERFGGTFGDVSINYEIVRNDSNTDDVNNDLIPSEGVVYFSEGQTSSEINITFIDDNIPEEAERYIVRILPSTVTGGASVRAPTEGQLLLVDSDDVYGVIQFSSDIDQSIAASESPRKLKLTLTRSGGLIGDILVNVTITYELPGEEESTIGIEDILDLASETTTVFPQDLSIHRFSINIQNDAYLSVNAVFKATLQEVDLLNYDTILPPSSPRIGVKDVVSLEVSPAEANSDVGFDQNSLKLEVEEPEEDAFTVYSIEFNKRRYIWLRITSMACVRGWW
ncbi:adhesion G-protein coupled receptor V1-like [Antedon mediterranea]|uniref:adhesion G-protein coupled receptor V1-like n=1 Tax=Antedon mediterranea TaxID=105859 RepID=UPI003AF8FFB4